MGCLYKDLSALSAPARRERVPTRNGQARAEAGSAGISSQISAHLRPLLGGVRRLYITVGKGNWNVHCLFVSLSFITNNCLWLATAASHQGKSFEGALLVKVLRRVPRSRSGTLCAARQEESRSKSASNYQIEQRWITALPHRNHLLRGHERWTICGRFTTMFMVMVRRTFQPASEQYSESTQSLWDPIFGELWTRMLPICLCVLLFLSDRAFLPFV
jgi:hypothetical protein